ncbi:MAG: hypothetical protein Alpg2KO_29140 [Alphaproteobacteria bacterium]
MTISAEILCLGAVSREPASGYAIRKMFEDGPLGHIHSLGYGSIYPALKRLSENGDLALEEAAEAEHDGEADRSKVYAITEQGLDRLRAALTIKPAPDKRRSDMFFILWLAEFLPEGHARRLIDERIAQYHHFLSDISNCSAGRSEAPGERLIHGFAKAIYSAAIDYLETEGRALAQEFDAAKTPDHGEED